jgi:hypothetical protein
MKQIITSNGYIQLIDAANDKQQGYQYGELMYKINGNDISFYFQEDYLYDNTLFSAYIPKLQIDGVTYTKEFIGGALDIIFRGNGSDGSGDMFKAQYDTNDNGIVDNAEKLMGYSPADLPISTEVQSAIDGINDDLVDVNTKITSNTNKLTYIATDITNINVEITSINNKIGDIDTILDNINGESI